MKRAKHAEKGMWIISLVLLSIAVTMFAVRAIGPEPLPTNQVLTTAAWDAFKSQDYSKAISKAKECVDEFRGSADREQDTLLSKKEALPPVGKVSEAQRQAIIARGLLNDVATCYYIIGRSAEFLGQLDIARDAYMHTVRYTYARTWDPAGWFWSPAEVAKDRLANLR
jgi:hypothetical protein